MRLCSAAACLIAMLAASGCAASRPLAAPVAIASVDGRDDPHGSIRLRLPPGAHVMICDTPGHHPRLMVMR